MSYRFKKRGLVKVNLEYSMKREIGKRTSDLYNKFGILSKFMRAGQNLP